MARSSTWRARLLDRAGAMTLSLVLGAVPAVAQTTQAPAPQAPRARRRPPRLAAAPTAQPAAQAGPQQAAQPAVATEPPAEAVAPAGDITGLVAPIALYPDPLLALILQASTLPLEVVQADRFLARRADDPSLTPDAGWDSSILGLLNYPQLIHSMSEYLDWTQDLGDAVVDRLPEVQDAIAQIRWSAYTSHILVSNDSQNVILDGNYIRIMPAKNDQVSIPSYDPVALLAAIEQPAPAAAEGAQPASATTSEPAAEAAPQPRGICRDAPASTEATQPPGSDGDGLAATLPRRPRPMTSLAGTRLSGPGPRRRPTASPRARSGRRRRRSSVGPWWAGSSATRSATTTTTTTITTMAATGTTARTSRSRTATSSSAGATTPTAATATGRATPRLRVGARLSAAPRTSPMAPGRSRTRSASCSSVVSGQRAGPCRRCASLPARSRAFRWRVPVGATRTTTTTTTTSVRVPRDIGKTPSATPARTARNQPATTRLPAATTTSSRPGSQAGAKAAAPRGGMASNVTSKTKADAASQRGASSRAAAAKPATKTSRPAPKQATAPPVGWRRLPDAVRQGRQGRFGARQESRKQGRSSGGGRKKR